MRLYLYKCSHCAVVHATAVAGEQPATKCEIVRSKSVYRDGGFACEGEVMYVGAIDLTDTPLTDIVDSLAPTRSELQAADDVEFDRAFDGLFNR